VCVRVCMCGWSSGDHLMVVELYTSSLFRLVAKLTIQRLLFSMST
jgi:hypothetical protein